MPVLSLILTQTAMLLVVGMSEGTLFGNALKAGGVAVYVILYVRNLWYAAININNNRNS